MFISPPPINKHNHCVGTRNHCVGKFTSKNYWKTTFRAPRLSGVPPSLREASIFRPKMPDIMPLLNLKKIIPFHSGGGGGAA